MNKTNKRIKCDLCNKEGLKSKEIVRLNNKKIWRDCYRRLRLTRRKELKKIIRERKKVERQYRPLARRKKKTTYNLKRDEKQTMFKLLENSGMNEGKIKERIRNLLTYETNLSKQIRQSKQEEKNKNKEFKEDFRKLKWNAQNATTKN